MLLLLRVAAATAPRRRLGDALDKEGLRSLAANGALGTAIRFKLNAESPLAKYVDAGARDALAAKVAVALDCESSAQRVFRPAAVHRSSLAAQFSQHDRIVAVRPTH
jgi:hypothetical protein